MRAGLDALRERGFDRLAGKRFALLCNQATIACDRKHILDLISPSVILGPQHGLWGHTQDNMIEWEGRPDPRFGCPIYSLYGERREPAPEWLHGLDLLVVDLPDIGSRYYTFAWSMALCLKVCQQIGLPVLVLDRPNPVGGDLIEGPGIEPGFESFVGLHSIPIRHGRTLGELALDLQQRFYTGLDLTVEPVVGWQRSHMAHDTGYPWAMPSPNMPTPDTALVYPGGCLLEGTNLSEGRGTTRPFETFGAPWLDGWQLASALNDLKLPGVWFRAIQFQPTFQKHAGQVCEGCFVHVVDRQALRPVLTYSEVLRVAWQQSSGRMQWKEPPYEYEFEKLPIDILWGSPALRGAVESGLRVSF